MKWLELTANNTFYTFRNWNDYREGCIEVPDDMPSPPLDWVWNFELKKFEAPVVIRTLEQARAEGYNRITAWFNNIQTTAFLPSIGFPMGFSRLDLQNFQELAYQMTRLGITATNVKDFDGIIHTCTLTQVESIRDDIGLHGLEVYQVKFGYETEMANATTIAECDAICQNT